MAFLIVWFAVGFIVAILVGKLIKEGMK